MKAVVQRILGAEVIVGGQTVGQVDRGLLVYVGIAHEDTGKESRRLADKIAALRIFEDDAGKMNMSVRDVAGGVLSIPNFTLQADASKGNRPTFTPAARPDQAKALYESFNDALREAGCPVATGVFGAHMEIKSNADGPVNIVLDMQSTVREE